MEEETTINQDTFSDFTPIRDPMSAMVVLIKQMEVQNNLLIQILASISPTNKTSGLDVLINKANDIRADLADDGRINNSVSKKSTRGK
jgi:hypothetical protein